MNRIPLLISIDQDIEKLINDIELLKSSNSPYSKIYWEMNPSICELQGYLRQFRMALSSEIRMELIAKHIKKGYSLPRINELVDIDLINLKLKVNQNGQGNNL